MDYGRQVRFGAFLTPTSADPEQVVGLAVHAEQVGLDLVTFQDHPYQPALLDAWTLLSFVAGRTTTIRLAPNVLNLPLRPPAVVARSAAALDLLSGGRFDLALGSGAFWDAVVAMGAPRRSPGEAVSALEDAIALIRDLWDTDTRGGVRRASDFYPVAGAKRGPRPAHPIEIWLGAYKPRMLRLVGSSADGWLPSMGYLPPSGLAAANRIIDEAAVSAGREPGAIRRLYNLDHDATDPGLLTDLALEQGIDTFILGSDDADLLSRFGREIAPGGPRRRRGRTPVNPSFTVRATPDDGRRLSAESVWDESTRPTGPDADPDRTYTPAQLANAQHLIDIHDHLRAELTQIRSLVAQVSAGTVAPGAARQHVNEMALRSNQWTVGAHCAGYHYLVTSHHTLEDRAMLPGLRRADPRLAPVLERLSEEHGIIHQVLERVDRALVEFVAGGVGADEALRRRVDQLSDALLSHLAYEERELVEPLARAQLFG